MKHRIAQFVVMLSLLIMGTFALQTSITHVSAQPAQPCYGDGCNGRAAVGICTFGAFPVRSTDIRYGFRIIARLSIIVSPRCGTYYARLTSFVGMRFEAASIQRGFLFFGSGIRYAIVTTSPMVGIRFRVPVLARGTINYAARNFTASVSYP